MICSKVAIMIKIHAESEVLPVTKFFHSAWGYLLAGPLGAVVSVLAVGLLFNYGGQTSLLFPLFVAPGIAFMLLVFLLGLGKR